MKKKYTLALAILLLGGCAAEQPLIPPPLDLPKKVLDYSSTQTPAYSGATLSTQITETPKPPPASKTQTLKTAPPTPPAAAEEANVSLAFEQIPLPSFIQIVYGSILKKNVNIDPAVVARKDLVTIRTGAAQTPTQAADATRMLLKSYGIAVMDMGSIVRIVPDNTNLGYLPEILRGRALPDTPLPLRPIFQLVELNAVRPAEVTNWIKTMFGDKVKIQDDIDRNAVMLSGQSDNVTAALEAIHLLDQPLLKGRVSARINAAYWSAEDLAKKLADVLQAEGYSAGSSAPFTWSITLLPVPAVNAIIVFTGDTAVLNHVVNWAKELDKRNEKGGGRSLFSYQAQYTDAAELAKTLQQLMGGGAAAPAAAAGKPAAVSVTPGRVVVDHASNTLIIQGGEDYSQILSLLQIIDKPAKEALIEVTVAELTLGDNAQLGIEWLIKEARLDGSSIVAGTLGGLTLGTSGFNYRRLDSAGDTKLLLNALASNNRATILSSPRVVARNGEAATIQVGQEVPIITSQQVAAGTSTSTNTTLTVPQSIQYRSTGVILNVKPVIHSGDMIDLDISQEVSAAQTTTTGVSTSPTFSTRKVQTKLSLKNGATVLLGGLISSNRSEGNAGIPLLKDIPGLGQLFRNNTENNDRTELIVLITPYIINDDNDAAEITKAFRKQLGAWAQAVPVAAGVPGVEAQPLPPTIPENRAGFPGGQAKSAAPLPAGGIPLESPPAPSANPPTPAIPPTSPPPPVGAPELPPPVPPKNAETSAAPAVGRVSAPARALTREEIFKKMEEEEKTQIVGQTSKRTAPAANQ